MPVCQNKYDGITGDSKTRCYNTVKLTLEQLLPCYSGMFEKEQQNENCELVSFVFGLGHPSAKWFTKEFNEQNISAKRLKTIDRPQNIEEKYKIPKFKMGIWPRKDLMLPNLFMLTRPISMKLYDTAREKIQNMMRSRPASYRNAISAQSKWFFQSETLKYPPP